MAHDVFISYATPDKPIADACCNILESNGIRCWVAPRDITPGTDWSAAIVDAIAGCRAVVLVFTANSNVSPQVKREIERAGSRGLPILPLRIEDVPLSKHMEFFISTPHWLDAMTPPLEAHMQHLARTVATLLDTEQVGRTPVRAPAAAPIPAEGRRWLPVAAAGMASILAIAAWFGLGLPPFGPDDPEPTPDPITTTTTLPAAAPTATSEAAPPEPEPPSTGPAQAEVREDVPAPPPPTIVPATLAAPPTTGGAPPVAPVVASPPADPVDAKLRRLLLRYGESDEIRPNTGAQPPVYLFAGFDQPVRVNSVGTSAGDFTRFLLGTREFYRTEQMSDSTFRTSGGFELAVDDCVAVPYRVEVRRDRGGLVVRADVDRDRLRADLERGFALGRCQ